jgi:transposase
MKRSCSSLKATARVQKVIPMSKSKPYSAVLVNRVVFDQVAHGREGRDLVVGIDVGKFDLLVVPRWADRDFGRPWRVANPCQIADLVALLLRLADGRNLRVALEPSGTYGDALRQALHDKGLAVLRVSPKAAHDYAEVFDGVPSQHDGKDAAVVAELAALNKAASWPYEVSPSWQEELVYWVDWLDAQRRLLALWSGRLEALLARHWPEATRVLRLTKATLLRTLEYYGGPEPLAADVAARQRLLGWGGPWLSAEKVDRLLEGAKGSVGVRQGEVQRRQVQEYASQALAALAEVRRSKRELQVLVKGHEVLTTQARVVGSATSCALWSSVGDPRGYSCGEAYRKAMGLNLTERSSGTYQGELHISKRGNPQSRHWLYLAALRLVKKAGLREWYQAKKARDGNRGKGALVGVMRRLALALHAVGAKGSQFEIGRLFPGKSVAQPSGSKE